MKYGELADAVKVLAREAIGTIATASPDHTKDIPEPAQFVHTIMVTLKDGKQYRCEITLRPWDSPR